MQKPLSSKLSSTEETELARKGVHPVQSVIRHKWIALSVIAAAVLAVGPAIVMLRRPSYVAEAVLMVSPVTKTLEDRESALPRYTEFVNQQAMMVAREDVSMDALNRLGEERSHWQLPGESSRDAAVRLSLALKVNRVPDTSYISVALERGHREGLVEIINAVIKAYLDRAKGQAMSGVDTRTEVLTRRVLDLQEDIRIKSDQLTGMSKELGVPGMETTMLTPLVTEMDRARRDAETRRVQAEARLAGVDARYKVLVATQADRSALEPDAELLQLRTALLARKGDLRSKLLGLTPAHEGRLAIEAAIEEIDAELKREEKAAHDRQIRAAIVKLEETRENERSVAQAELAQAKKYEEVIARETAALNEKLLRLYPEAQGLKQEVERLRAQPGTVQGRLDALRLEPFAPGFVQLAMPAAISEVSKAQRTMKGVALLAFAAIFLTFAVPVAFDMARNRVRGAEDLDGVVITIPTWKGDRRRDPGYGDQLRRLALALDRERRLHNRSAFIFTSVLPGAGTSQLVLDVASELGKFGVLAMAIEANALKPDPKYRVNGHPGLAVGMPKGIRAAEMVNPGDDELPDRIGVGATEGRTTLPGLEKIDSFLGQVLGRYQAVLVDAPPILQSADAEYLASRGQAVVLVVEDERTPVSELDRANQILRQVGANVVLTVMNRSRRWKKQGQLSSVALSEAP